MYHVYVFVFKGGKIYPNKEEGSKSFNLKMNHSQRAGFSEFELSGKFVEKSRKHVLRCASVCLFVCLLE